MDQTNNPMIVMNCECELYTVNYAGVTMNYVTLKLNIKRILSLKNEFISNMLNLRYFNIRLKI